MNIKRFDPYLQSFLSIGLILLNTYLLFANFSYFIVLSIVLLKIYQIVGGGGIHLWACHGIGESRINKFIKNVILFCWMLCGISRGSYFCKYHIMHHSDCDKQGDPHSPNDHNPLVLSLGLWTLSAKEKDQFITPQTQSKIDRSLARIESSWLDKYYFLILFTVIAVSLAISPFFALYFITLPMLFNIIDGNFFFVYYFHRKGTVRDIPWVSYWILSSGHHRKHHKWLR